MKSRARARVQALELDDPEGVLVAVTAGSLGHIGGSLFLIYRRNPDASACVRYGRAMAFGAR